MATDRPIQNLGLANADCATWVDTEMLKDDPEPRRGENAELDRRIRRAKLELYCARLARGEIVAAQSTPAGQLVAMEAAKAEQDKKEEGVKELESRDRYLGLNWGLGFGFSFSSDDRVSDAEIVNNTVRVKTASKQEPRLILEFHRFFWCHGQGAKVGTTGCGPFVAVAASSEKVLSGVGMGFMYGMKTAVADTEGFSLGLGLILDSKVKDLGEGFEANQPPPAGEMAVRFEEKSRWSVLLFMTRTF